MAKKKTYDDDDGRVIAKMNIEGTPWYVKGTKVQDGSTSDESIPDMKETYHIMKGALSAGLLIGMIFVVVFFLFILFCTLIWFK